MALRERRQDEDRGGLHLGDLLGRGDAVEPGHLDVEDRQIGLVFTDEIDRLVTTTALGDDLVALLLEHLLEIEADDGFVFSDHDTRGHGCSRSSHSPDGDERPV